MQLLRIQEFWNCESGAASVEWMLFTSFVVALSASVFATMESSSVEYTQAMFGIAQNHIIANW